MGWNERKRVKAITLYVRSKNEMLRFTLKRIGLRKELLLSY
ncbi:hypothetical protein [Umezakia ovalisporum]